jgi:hypothetical protein
MRTMRTMAGTMGMIGGALLCLAGCGAKATHTLVANIDYTIAGGDCVFAEGPYSIPNGAVTSWSMFDSNGDAMAIAVVDDASVTCDPASGYAYSNTVGSAFGSEAVPGSTYDLVILCLNAPGDSCLPTLDYWQYD